MAKSKKDGDEDGKGGVWALIGKIGVAITVVGGGLGIWTGVTAPEGELVADVTYADTEFSPYLDEYHKRNARELQSYIREDMVKLKGDLPKTLIAIRDKPEFFATVLSVNVLEKDAFAGEGIVRAEISNRGDATLKNVRFISETAVRAGLIHRPNGAPERVLSDYTKKLLEPGDDERTEGASQSMTIVDLGDMPARTTVKLLLFVDDPLYDYKANLVHENGTGKVKGIRDRYKAPFLAYLPAALTALAFVLTVLAGYYVLRLKQLLPKKLPPNQLTGSQNDEEDSGK